MVQSSSKKVGYPNGINRPKNLVNPTMKDFKDTSKVQHQSGRGMGLEQMIRIANQYYDFKDIAWIRKQDVKTKIEYEQNNSKWARVVGPSTVDYEGLIGALDGRHFAMEAKSTRTKDFKVKMGVAKYETVRRNQVESLEQVMRFHGLAYWLIAFQKTHHVYLVNHQEFRQLVPLNRVVVETSIPESDIADVGILVPSRFEIELDYLQPLLKSM